MNYTCFSDNESKIRFYYNKSLKISNKDEYNFFATSGTGMYLTSISYKFEKKDTQNFNLDKYIEESFANSKVAIQEVTISHINPIAVKRVDILDMDRMNMTFYIFANENGVATIGVLNLLNPTIPETITKKLDTIIVEDTI